MITPPQPPEGALIENARKAAGMSARDAARRAGISEGWWRQVTRGYQKLSGGESGPIRAPARTIASMARAVRVTPDLLAGAGREDAAAILKEAPDILPPPPPAFPVLQPDPDELGAWERAVWSEVSDALARHGPGVTGAQVFPGSAVEASVWDTRRLPDREAKVRLVAKLRAISDESSAESRAG